MPELCPHGLTPNGEGVVAATHPIHADMWERMKRCPGLNKPIFCYVEDRPPRQLANLSALLARANGGGAVLSGWVWHVIGCLGRNEC
jgi:hypothetical protein